MTSLSPVGAGSASGSFLDEEMESLQLDDSEMTPMQRMFQLDTSRQTNEWGRLGARPASFSTELGLGGSPRSWSGTRVPPRRTGQASSPPLRAIPITFPPRPDHAGPAATPDHAAAAATPASPPLRSIASSWPPRSDNSSLPAASPPSTSRSMPASPPSSSLQPVLADPPFSLDTPRPAGAGQSDQRRRNAAAGYQMFMEQAEATIGRRALGRGSALPTLSQYLTPPPRATTRSSAASQPAAAPPVTRPPLSNARLETPSDQTPGAQTPGASQPMPFRFITGAPGFQSLPPGAADDPTPLRVIIESPSEPNT